ncbi:hypothetical protein L1765_10090 [Microaerobacter geothermalis]|uniref:hypothetical protein n=1 Tax=Microaerobacter geothermalis TaxID=674972 RepID=UPI001F3E7E5B|nr:hypothetical protein [Microaerobacter geothermalis]MCF6094312.1 hypothetical protein [Microaerobacter geothermalis]
MMRINILVVFLLLLLVSGSVYAEGTGNIGGTEIKPQVNISELFNQEVKPDDFLKWIDRKLTELTAFGQEFISTVAPKLLGIGGPALTIVSLILFAIGAKKILKIIFSMVALASLGVFLTFYGVPLLQTFIKWIQS